MKFQILYLLLLSSNFSWSQCTSITSINISSVDSISCGNLEFKFVPELTLDSSGILLSSQASPNNFLRAFNFSFPTNSNCCTYFLEIKGSYTPWGNNNWFDAYAKYNSRTNQFISIGGMGHWFLSPPAVIVPTAYNPNHEYYYYYLGEGTTIVFSFWDSPYYDNSGGVTFNWYGVPCYEYYWNFGDGNTSSLISPTHVFESTGTYEVTLTVTDKLLNCSKTQNVTIVVNPSPIVNIIAIHPCENEENGKLEIESVGEHTPYQFSLNQGNLTEDNIFDGLITGIYEIVVTDTNGCVTKEDEALFSNPLPNIDSIIFIRPDCEEEYWEASVFAGGGTKPFQYSLDGTNYQASNSFFNLNHGEQVFYVQDGNNCQAIESRVLESSAPLFIENIISYPIGCEGKNGELIFNVSGGKGQISISLNGNPAQERLVFQDLEAGTYDSAITDETGCWIDTLVTISRLVCSLRNLIYVPNVFSPNNDGFNDFFQIYIKEGLEAQINTYRIFDRWGEHIYQAIDFPINSSDQWWDGKFNGNELKTGVFLYYIEIESENGKKANLSGDITILKTIE